MREDGFSLHYDSLPTTHYTSLITVTTLCPY